MKPATARPAPPRRPRAVRPAAVGAIHRSAVQRSAIQRPGFREPQPSISRGWLVLVAACLALSACGGGGDASPSAPAGAAPRSPEAKAVADYMRDWYLWSDRMPAADPPDVETAEAMLDALRARPIDRYSYVEPRAVAQAFFDAGRTVGLGLGYAVAPDNATLAVRFVQPESPAAAAGLVRGDRIVAVDATPVPTLVAENRVAAAFGPATAGVSVTLRVQRAGGTNDLAITKAPYDFRAVQADRIIEAAGRRIGYVYLSSFTDPTVPAWRDAIARLAAAGAQDLVVDLRDNGGGRLSAAAAVAGTLAPAAADQPFWFVRFNARRTGSNYVVRMGAPLAGANFDRVVALTSGVTCSASELLVFGLAPWRTVERVGGTTCGKPVGFVPEPVGADKLLNAVSFGGANRDTPAEYYDGLAPRCAATDDWARPFGDTADPLVAAAVSLITTGACPAPAAAERAPQAGGPAAKAAPGPDRDATPGRPAQQPWRGPLDWAGLR